MNATAFHFPAGPNYPLPISSAPHGCRVEDIPADLKTWDGWSPRDCLNLDPEPPAGWYSVAHWAALTEWAVFETFDQPMEEVLSEWLGAPWQAQAMKLAAAEGITPIVWPAPPKVAAAGFPTVLLFPDPVLREVFRF